MKRTAAIIFLLIAGLGIYWMFSPNIYFFKILGITNHAVIKATGLMLLLRNFLPDLLWAIAINLTAIVMGEKKFPEFYIYALIILPFLSEILQYTGLIPGTFDWCDLLIYSITYIFCFKFKTPRLCKTNSENSSAPLPF